MGTPVVQIDDPPVPWWAYACLAASMALVGTYVALAKPLTLVLPVLTLAWLRFMIAALLTPHWLRPEPGARPLGWRLHGLLFLESLFGNVLFSVCMLQGVRLSGAVAAGVVMAAIPAVVALLSWACLRERIRPPMRWAIGFAVLGVGLLAVSKGEQPTPIDRALEAKILFFDSPLWGHILLLGAVVCEAIYAVLGKRLSAQVPPRRITAIINVWGLVLITPCLLWQWPWVDWDGLGVHHLVLLLFYALAASVWSVWLWMTGLQHVPAARAGVFTVMLPIAAALIGVLVLGEPLGCLPMLALASGLLAVWLATRPERPA